MSLANRVKGLNDAALLDCFISRLKPELYHDVIAQSSHSLLHAMALSQLYADKITIANTWGRLKLILMPSTSFSFSPKSQSSTSPEVAIAHSKVSPLPLLPTLTSKLIAPIKKLPAAEMQLNREKGLCFTSDEMFS